MKKVSITVRVPQNVYAATRKILEQKDNSFNGVVCQALRLYLIYCAEEEKIKRRWITDLNLDPIEGGQTSSWTLDIGEME